MLVSTACDPLRLDRKGIAFTLLISCLYVLPLCLVNSYFKDDFSRIFSGQGWSWDARFAATFFSQTASGSLQYVFNLFPFSLLASAALAGLTGYLIAALLGLEEDSPFKVSSLLLLTSPYYLENLSYKFDHLMMTLPLFLVIVPYLCRARPAAFFVLSALSLYLALGMYQVAAMAYFAMLICTAARDLQQNRFLCMLRSAVLGALAFAAAFLLYKAALHELAHELPQRGELILSEPDFLHRFKDKVLALHQYFQDTLLNTSWRYLLELLLVTSGVGVVLWVCSPQTIEQPTRILVCLVMLPAGLAALWLLAGMPNLLIKDPWLTARVRIAVPFLFYFLLIWQRDLWIGFTRIAAGALVCYSFLLCAVYTEALKNNEEYTRYINNMIAPWVQKPEIKKLAIKGCQPPTPRNRLIYQNFPLVKSILMNYQSEQHYAFGFLSLTRYATPGEYEEISDEANRQLAASMQNADVVMQNRILTLRTGDDVLLIEFPGSSCE